MASFQTRHLGSSSSDDTNKMLTAVGVSSINALIDQTVPGHIKLKKPFDVCEPLTEYEYDAHIQHLASKNQVFKSYLGMGYYNTILPNVIRRNILENPGWYTAYTPYQAEISQGRLEGLLNFQTMVSDLTAMPIANASLLDEATAASEAMIMLYNTRTRDQIKQNTTAFFVDELCFPQTIEVIKAKAKPLNINVIIGHFENMSHDQSYFGVLLQYPNKNGDIYDYQKFTKTCHEQNIRVAVATDLLSLTLLTPPGEWGADVVIGSSQRFGVPMGYGGPHAAFFATLEDFKRNIPGRIIGVSVDRNGNQALRMALQTREQHIRRDKATSNICTAQALLAIMAGTYAVYHGPEGLKKIAQNVHQNTCLLAQNLKDLGLNVKNKNFFDTLLVQLNENELKNIKLLAEENKINFWYNANTLSISLDETTSTKDVNDIVQLFAKALNKKLIWNTNTTQGIDNNLLRTSSFLTNAVFSKYQTETELMRYLKKLENKDVSLTRSMISLGSCTMKLNAASQLFPISIPEFANIHPFAPIKQTAGYQEIFKNLEDWLCKITGFDAISFQPNSGAQGEYAGLMVIKAYQESIGEGYRNIALIPSSAHGTNPASAVMAGMNVVVVKCDDQGNIDLEDLHSKVEKHKEHLSALMVTYPSTHGVFEEAIMEITDLIHNNGGQVYMDGANMNAQVGITNPATIGADVCHLNLHKTFAIPHGGGGPGVGPIGVKNHLANFLPKHPVIDLQIPQGIGSISAAPWGSALILLISYGYIKMLGTKGLLDSTQLAILNANYIKAKLEQHYPILYSGKNGKVAHEMIVDCRAFKRSVGIEVEDIAKRLIDYGFHAPTVSFPVAGTLMIEPTESESIEELDRFCDAMISIRKEIQEIEDGIADKNDNVLKNAPHPASSLVSNSWPHAYDREKAAYPLNWVRENKYWVPVARVDNAHGDRNLICTCPTTESYAAAEV